MTSTEGFKGFITFTGLVVLVGLTTATVLYTSQADNISSEASTKNIEPREIEVSSLDAKTLKITWTTIDKTLGTLFYTDDQSSKCLTKNSNTVDCDFVIENSEKNKHEIELKDLVPEKKYFYKIKINNEMYPANGILLSFTVPKIEEPQPIQAELIESSVTPTPSLIPTSTPTPRQTTPEEVQGFKTFYKKPGFIESEGFSQ